ncbi:MAG: hypothetical protein H7Y10_12220 [Flavobacterium sp.]|nr:hypothetical protein [Flavobacterium sp.]
MEELVKKATELGIENAEALSPSQLKKAIAKAEKEVVVIPETTQEDTAEIVVPETTQEEIQEETPESIVPGVSDEDAFMLARQAEIVSTMSRILGIDDIDTLSLEEVEAILEKYKNGVTINDIPVVDAEELGRTSNSFACKGKEYIFHEDSPAAFRYLGQFRTQEEWMSDEDAMELMVAGNLSFLTLKK